MGRIFVHVSLIGKDMTVFTIMAITSVTMHPETLLVSIHSVIVMPGSLQKHFGVT